MSTGNGWRIVRASVAGTSHRAAGVPCQDACHVAVHHDLSGRAAFVSFVADGAGSARFGREGAQIAVTTAWAASLVLLGSPSWQQPDEGWAQALLGAVRAAIGEAAAAAEAELRDFACTLLGAVVVGDTMLLMQIGDGGIVVRLENVWELPIAPMNGEYANSTRFATDDDAAERLAVRILTVRKDDVEVALFTDGLQRLALRIGEGVPHAPFFSAIFDPLRGKPVVALEHEPDEPERTSTWLLGVRPASHAECEAEEDALDRAASERGVDRVRWIPPEPATAGADWLGLADDVSAADRDLAEWLASPPVAARTDDDLTLVLAQRVYQSIARGIGRRGAPPGVVPNWDSSVRLDT